MASQPESIQPTDFGKSIVIKGDLSASEDLTLYGQMEGSINLPAHTLTIGPHADIKAAIAAKAVVILGAVTGSVSAREKVEIQTRGSVTGDVDAPRLAMHDGGYLCGKVQMPNSTTSSPASARGPEPRNSPQGGPSGS
jgi:cytoskeletal protein CcmA (bactofilin family)